jgi:hypothetical protein
MKRSTLAFILAPLAVPLLLLPWLLAGHLAVKWTITAMIIAALITYAGVVALGIPTYSFLRARGFTTVWIAGIAGFLIGAVMWLVFSVLFPISLGQGVSGAWLALTDFKSLSGIIWPGGVSGLVVGVLFWMIARPDR